MLKRNLKNRLGQDETYRTLSYRRCAYGCVKKIEKGIVYFEKIFYKDLDVREGYEFVYRSPEPYIYSNKTIKKMGIKEGEWIEFRGTLMNYSVAKDGYGEVNEGLGRLVNIRNIKRIEVK